MIKSIFIALLLMSITTTCLAGKLTISTDTSNISFGAMDIGEQKELGGYGYHNQLTCKSTNGRTWYVKIHVLAPLTSQGIKTISNSYFRYMLAWTDGTGSPQNTSYNAFTTIPTLVYVSGPNDNDGNSVNMQFKYDLSIPANQVAGVYNTIVRYTMTEVL